MVAKGRGGGKTPYRVVDLLNEEERKSSQAATARGTGLTLQTVQRYIKGIGEPSTATLQKIADYFGVSVPWLRGGRIGCRERLLEGMKLSGFGGDAFNKATVFYGAKENGEYWSTFILGEVELDKLQFERYCNTFNINSVWVISGLEPPKHECRGVVGTISPVYDSVTLAFWGTAETLPHLPLAVCAKCGSQLKPGNQRSSLEGREIICYWPCETCCN